MTTRGRLYHAEAMRQAELGNGYQPLCVYCGDKVTRANASVDHVLPFSLGGLPSPDNEVLCCRSCNQLKHNADIALFRHRLACKALGWPAKVSRDMVAWARELGADLRSYDDFQFYFELQEAGMHDIARIVEARIAFVPRYVPT